MLRRSRIKKKPKKTKVSWRSGKVRLDAEGMENLRVEVYIRCGGGCENTLNVDDDTRRCNAWVTWNTFEMHHVIHRSLSGSDSLQNCLALCRECHSNHHLKGLEIVPYRR